jgi:hypothetical protein
VVPSFLFLVDFLLELELLLGQGLSAAFLGGGLGGLGLGGLRLLFSVLRGEGQILWGSLGLGLPVLAVGVDGLGLGLGLGLLLGSGFAEYQLESLELFR